MAVKMDIQHYRFNIKIHIFLEKVTYLNALGTISTACFAAQPRAIQLIAARDRRVAAPRPLSTSPPQSSAAWNSSAELCFVPAAGQNANWQQLFP